GDDQPVAVEDEAGAEAALLLLARHGAEVAFERFPEFVERILSGSLLSPRRAELARAARARARAHAHVRWRLDRRRGRDVDHGGAQRFGEVREVGQARSGGRRRLLARSGGLDRLRLRRLLFLLTPEADGLDAGRGGQRGRQERDRGGNAQRGCATALTRRRIHSWVS